MTLSLKNQLTDKQLRLKPLPQIFFLFIFYVLTLIPSKLLKIYSNSPASILMLMIALTMVFTIYLSLNVYKKYQILKLTNIFKTKDFKENLFFALSILGLIYISTQLVQYFVPADNIRDLYDVYGGNVMFFILQVVFFLPIIDELIFRVGVNTLFNNKYAAVFVSSLLYASANFNFSFYQFVNYFIIGFLLCCIFIKTKQVEYCIICHLLNNILACTFIFFLK